LLNLRVFQQYLRIPTVHRAVFGGKRAIEFDPSLALGCLARAAAQPIAAGAGRRFGHHSLRLDFQPTA